MRIYNGKNSLIDLPLTNRARITIPAHSVSKEFMPSEEFINMVVAAYTEADIALVISGPYELNLCAKNPVVCSMITHTLDEAVIRFNGPAQVEVSKEEEANEEVLPEPEVVETQAEAPKSEEPTPKKRNKKN